MTDSETEMKEETGPELLTETTGGEGGTTMTPMTNIPTSTRRDLSTLTFPVTGLYLLNENLKNNTLDLTS